MQSRLSIYNEAPEIVKAMLAVEKAIAAGPVETSLIKLVKIRASQINGCAYCIYMHVNEAIKAGETAMRIHMLSAWHESPLFSERERAALAWTESLTRVAETGAPDSDFALVRDQFDDQEIGYLTFMIGAINSWNRIQVGLRAIHNVQDSDRPAKRVA